MNKSRFHSALLCLFQPFLVWADWPRCVPDRRAPPRSNCAWWQSAAAALWATDKQKVFSEENHGRGFDSFYSTFYFFFIWGRLEIFLKLFTISSGYSAFFLRLTQTFLEKEESCWGTATFLDFDWVMLEDSYLFDYLYHEKLLTTDQVLCFQPVSCPAADIQKAMSAYNRPR